jgi:hypothetical protein
MRFEVSMAMKMIVVSWTVIPHELVDGVLTFRRSILVPSSGSPSTSSREITAQEATVIFIVMTTPNLI